MGYLCSVDGVSHYSGLVQICGDLWGGDGEVNKVSCTYGCSGSALLEILGTTCRATHMIDSSMVCMILAQTSMKSACAMHGSCFTFWHATSMTRASPLA